ncbi:MAG: arginine repressor [Clostridiales bacterium]|nr:arginine repressor [Clostridiales bacterium]
MKKERQRLIVNFIENNNVSTQEEIINMLASNGYKVTQATISRDINELKLVKDHYGKNKTRYCISEVNNRNDNFRAIFFRSVLSVETAMNIVVIKCYSGTAVAACTALDTQVIEGVVGAVAGDDTIFVACTDAKHATDIKNCILENLKD